MLLWVKNDLLVTVSTTGEVMTVGGEFDSVDQDGVQQIVFADGTALNRSQIDAEAWFRAGAGDVMVSTPYNSPRAIPKPRAQALFFKTIKHRITGLSKGYRGLENDYHGRASEVCKKVIDTLPECNISFYGDRLLLRKLI